MEGISPLAEAAISALLRDGFEVVRDGDVCRIMVGETEVGSFAPARPVTTEPAENAWFAPAR